MISSLIVLLVAIGAFALGWYQRELWERVKRLELSPAQKPQEEPEEPRSMIFEPRDETPAERAKREQDDLIRTLNPPQ